VLDAERRHAKRTLGADEYANIWLGKTKAAVEGAIYAAEIREAIERRRVTSVLPDPSLRMHVVLDLGWNDAMFAILVQRHLSEMRVVESIEEDHRTLDWLSNELRTRRHNWGTMFLPHDGAHGDYKTGKSAKQIMQSMGWQVQMVPNLSVEAGLRAARMALERTFIDKDKAGRLVHCLRRYRRNVNDSTGEPGAPLHDEYSHGADAYRYAAIVADRMSNDMDMPRIERHRITTYQPDPVLGL
jgi:phage terminase large subunit